MTSPRVFLRISLATGAICALLVVAGCSSGTGDTDPATLAPAATPVLVEVTVDPAGDQETALRELMANFPGGDAEASGGLISSLIATGLTAAGAPIDYAEDIQPWLGESAALIVTGINGETQEPDVAVVLSTTDAEQAKAALEKTFPGGRSATQQGVEYKLDASGEETLAVGLIDNFVVIGTPSAFTAAVDASKGESLSESDTYANVISQLPESRIAAFYIDPKALVQIGTETAGMGGPEMAAQQAALEQVQPIVGSVAADANGVAIDSVTAKVPGMVVPPPGVDVLSTLPGNSGVALGIPDLGPSVKASLEQAGGSTGMDPATINTFIQSATGIDAIALLDWIGNTGIFVSGSSLDDVGGGLVIESKDPAASADSLESIQGLLGKEKDVSLGKALVDGDAGFSIQSKDLPEPIVVEQSGSQVAITLGTAAAEAALGEDARLGENTDFTAAIGRLGSDYDPSLYIGLGPILEFAAKNFDADKDPAYPAIEPFLTPLTDITAGSKVEGDNILSRLRLDVE